MTNLPHGTKRDILQLLVRDELSANELAVGLGLTPAGVRAHLATLSALGLVERRRVAGAANRPTEFYRLSAAGRRAFPKRYDLLLAQLVEVLADRYGVDGLVDAVAAAARRLAARAGGEFAALAPTERWARLLQWLDGEFAWETDSIDDAEGGHRLVVHQCPFLDVSSNRPVVCGAFFASLIQALYGEAAVQHLPGAEGEACCAFSVEEREGRGKRRQDGKWGG
jgi:predicted ArsR family transcriptional regulator